MDNRARLLLEMEHIRRSQAGTGPRARPLSIRKRPRLGGLDPLLPPEPPGRAVDGLAIPLPVRPAVPTPSADPSRAELKTGKYAEDSRIGQCASAACG